MKKKQLVLLAVLATMMLGHVNEMALTVEASETMVSEDTVSGESVIQAEASGVVEESAGANSRFVGFELTKDIYRYDAGKGKFLTYINGKGYSQYSYLNKSGKYAFTPSSWMKAAGLNVSMPSKANGFKMVVTNPYKDAYYAVSKAVTNYEKGVNGSGQALRDAYNKYDHMLRSNVTKATPKKVASTKTLTTDIVRYNGFYESLTSISGRGYSQYTYLNKKGSYAFTPSSWMRAAGLTVDMPGSWNGYTMNITNSYINNLNNVLNKAKGHIKELDSKPACKDVTTTIHHKEQGHYENKIIKEAWTEIVSVYTYTHDLLIHNTTGWTTTSVKEMNKYLEDRMMNHEDYAGYTIIPQSEYVDKEVHHPAEYGDVWVVTKPAWTETVTNRVCK